MKQKRIFCGGTFCFDYRDVGYEIQAAQDYRAELLEEVEALLRPKEAAGVKINDDVVYVGPFYFETDDMQAEDIVRCEKQMIESCTDALFLLDGPACPGTVAEIMYANSLNKYLHIFYICRSEDEETESELHTPCWYPILFCRMTNPKAHIHPCRNMGDAKQKISDYVSCGINSIC